MFAMSRGKLFLTLYLLQQSGVLADGCAQLCSTFPNVCGRGGSYCKGDFCHDLFWANPIRTILCHNGQAGCPQSDPLRCDDVGRFTGDSFIPETRRSESSSPRPLVASTTSSTSTTTAPSRRVTPVGTSPRSVPDVTRGQAGPLPGTQGMPNLGAMCYFSSVLQPLLHTAAFREATFSSAAPHIRGSAASGVVAETNRLNHRMWFPEAADREHLFTDSIVGSMRTYTNGRMFNIGTADDSAWAIREYISALVTGDAALYGPLFRTRVRTYQQCLGLAMCVPGPSVEDRNMLILAPGYAASVPELIRDQFQAGMIAGHACDVCGSADPGVVRTPTIVRGARVLAVALEREDASIRVETPLEMDLTGIVASEDGPLVYRLVGIARHHGAHYTSHFRHPDTNEWYSADDSRVRIGRPDLTSTNSRLVIYERI